MTDLRNAIERLIEHGLEPASMVFLVLLVVLWLLSVVFLVFSARKYQAAKAARASLPVSGRDLRDPFDGSDSERKPGGDDASMSSTTSGSAQSPVALEQPLSTQVQSMTAGMQPEAWPEPSDVQPTADAQPESPDGQSSEPASDRPLPTDAPSESTATQSGPVAALPERIGETVEPAGVTTPQDPEVEPADAGRVNAAAASAGTATPADSEDEAIDAERLKVTAAPVEATTPADPEVAGLVDVAPEPETPQPEAAADTPTPAIGVQALTTLADVLPFSFSPLASPAPQPRADILLATLARIGQDPREAAPLADLIRALYLDQSMFTFDGLGSLGASDRKLAAALLNAWLSEDYDSDRWESAFQATQAFGPR